MTLSPGLTSSIFFSELFAIRILVPLIKQVFPLPPGPPPVDGGTGVGVGVGEGEGVGVGVSVIPGKSLSWRFECTDESLGPWIITGCPLSGDAIFGLILPSIIYAPPRTNARRSTPYTVPPSIPPLKRLKLRREVFLVFVVTCFLCFFINKLCLILEYCADYLSVK